MKKIFTVTLALSLSLIVSAQIQRSFFGNSIGSSTKEEVINNFISKGKKVVNGDSDGIIVKGLEFAGITWQEVHFMFINNKFYQIAFCCGDKTDKDGIYKSLHSYIIDSLTKKYPQYKQLENNNKVYFYDNNTRVNIEYDFLNGQMILLLQYYDVKSVINMINKSQNDL